MDLALPDRRALERLVKVVLRKHEIRPRRGPSVDAADWTEDGDLKISAWIDGEQNTFIFADAVDIAWEELMDRYEAAG